MTKGDGGLRDLCHSCEFDCQQMVLKTLIMTFTGKFVYMARHFILLRLNRLDLSIHREEWWFERAVSESRFPCN